MSINPTARQVAEYFRSHFKHPQDHLVGMEVEHICTRPLDGCRISYASDDSGVKDILHQLQRRLGGEKTEEADQLIGLRGPWGKVTLEPGNQVEWSSSPRSTCHELLGDLEHWQSEFSDTLGDLQLMSLATGYDPTDVRHVPQLPKHRYELMRERYASDDVAYRAMSNTAGVHVNFDCSDETDWQRKFRLMLLSSPAAIALFANSPGKLGNIRYAAVRPVLWRRMDCERCDFPAAAFQSDYSLIDHACWVADRPMLLTKEQGTICQADGRSLVEYFPDGGVPQDVLELHTGSIFTPVRTNGTLEVRTIDTQAPEVLSAVPAFWTGLLNHQPTLDRALDLVKGIRTKEEWVNLFTRACRFGLHDPELAGQALELLNLATDGLQACEGDQSSALAALNRVADGQRADAAISV